MRVLLLSRYSWAGNSSRHRSLKYLPYLRAHDIDVIEAPLSDDGYIADLYSGQPRRGLPLIRAYGSRLARLLGSRRFDLVWTERELFPMLPAVAERLLAAAGVKYVVDYDDAIFHNYDRHGSAWIRALLGRKIDRVMQHAALVIVGNPYLGDRARRAGARRVEQLPTAVDLDRYPLQPESAGREFTVGWMGSPPNARYLGAIHGALRSITEGARARVIVVGSGAGFNLPGVRFEMVPWAEDQEAQTIGTFDVGIMPLPDEPFERGKCGFKILQYFAAGRPVVASPVGINRAIVRDGINGYLANTPREWVDALERLQADPSGRRRMGLAGRKLVEDEYSTAIVAPKLAAILR